MLHGGKAFCARKQLKNGDGGFIDGSSLSCSHVNPSGHGFGEREYKAPKELGFHLGSATTVLVGSFWCLGLIWALYTVYTSDLDEDEDFGLSL